MAKSSQKSIPSQTHTVLLPHMQGLHSLVWSWTCWRFPLSRHCQTSRRLLDLQDSIFEIRNHIFQKGFEVQQSIPKLPAVWMGQIEVWLGLWGHLLMFEATQMLLSSQQVYMCHFVQCEFIIYIIAMCCQVFGLHPIYTNKKIDSEPLDECSIALHVQVAQGSLRQRQLSGSTSAFPAAHAFLAMHRGPSTFIAQISNFFNKLCAKCACSGNLSFEVLWHLLSRRPLSSCSSLEAVISQAKCKESSRAIRCAQATIRMRTWMLILDRCRFKNFQTGWFELQGTSRGTFSSSLSKHFHALTMPYSSGAL